MSKMMQGLMLVALLPSLSACQYASFFRTNTAEYPRTGQASSDATCMAMGSMKGDASYDWCVEEEERARGHESRYFPVSPNEDGGFVR
ncbi:MAG: hypothetical protein EBV03_07310 [Proteobacteria bacterium]|nr:hypothetical protein [Pseudomonadota bacterium]